MSMTHFRSIEKGLLSLRPERKRNESEWLRSLSRLGGGQREVLPKLPVGGTLIGGTSFSALEWGD